MNHIGKILVTSKLFRQQTRCSRNVAHKSECKNNIIQVLLINFTACFRYQQYERLV